MKTFSLKKSNAKNDWQLIDAQNQPLGRLSTKVATILMGKNKPNYTPHIIGGDKVIVINAAKIKITGKKLTDKIYYRHSGYPGGIKSISLKDQMEKDPTKVIARSVGGMLPKNKLAAKMLANLKIYTDNHHPHQAQINYKKDKG